MIGILKKIRNLMTRQNKIDFKLDKIQQSLGRIELRQVQNCNVKKLIDSEFQVSSQWGEDGIIQFLIRKVPIERKIFVEFGVQDYTESNTRFLLQNNNWAGLVIDGSKEHIDIIKKHPIYWRYNLKAECAFIARDNINSIIVNNGISGDIGLLSIDIDGNDYWVWEAIECISPRIVICEYNSIFGPRAKIIIPYNKVFERTRAHFSNLYWGASISAIYSLAKNKGYLLVGSNSAGNNAFFVRDDVSGDLPAFTPMEAYVQAQFRESRNKDSILTYLNLEQGLRVISDMPVFDLDTQKIVKISELNINF